MVLTVVPGPLDALGISVFDNVLSASVLTDLLFDLRDAPGEPAVV